MTLTGIAIFLVITLVLLFVLWFVAKEQGEAAGDHHHEKPVHDAPVIEKKKPAANKADDLTKIEGIGPKIAILLTEKGYQSFSDLAKADTAALNAILEDAKLKHLADPATWGQQAQLAADGKWDTLEELQDQLKGGRAA